MDSGAAAELLIPVRGSIDEIVYDYLHSLLVHHEGWESESVGDLMCPLLEHLSIPKETIEVLAEKVERLLPNTKKAEHQLVPLEAPILMQEIISSTHRHESVDLEALSSTKHPSNPTSKAEKRAKAAEKRDLFHPTAQPPAYSLENLDSFDSRGKCRDLRLETLDVSVPGRRILTNTALCLAHGRRYGLVGRNGVGKSTLLRHLSARILPVPLYLNILHIEQEAIGDDTPAIESVLRAHALRHFLLQQEALISEQLADESVEHDNRSKWLTRMRIVSNRLREIDSDRAETKASLILLGLGFTQDQLRLPTRVFSGGWRMRLALAGALLCEPDILLLDEPTNMLDIPAVVWLQQYLVRWPNTILIVSHDQAFLNSTCTDTLHMHDEQLDSYRGPYSTFIQTREERVKNAQREYDAQVLYRNHLQDFIDRWRYNAARAAQAQSKIKILERLPALVPITQEAKIEFSFAPVDRLSPPLIQLDDVSFGWTAGKVLLEKISLSLLPESRVAIVGANGTGKTTLLKLMAGLLDPVSGRCQRNGRLKFAFFAQHHVDQLDLSENPVEYLARRFPGNTEEHYRRSLGAFGLGGPLALQTIGTLSGGQKSRVIFAAMYLQAPHVLILDEPTNHLDMDSIEALVQALNSFNGGVIVVSHDQRFLRAACRELWLCCDRTVRRFDGDVDDYVASLLGPASN